MRLVLAFVLLTGCQGPKGDKGEPGSAGATGPAGSNGTNGSNGMNGTTPDGGVAPSTTSCSPTQAFCENNRVWYCTKSGADAFGGGDCAASANSSANNPYSCATAGCPIGQTACCKPAKPVYIINIGGAIPFAATSYVSGDIAGLGYIPIAMPAPGCANMTAFFEYFNSSMVAIGSCTASTVGVTTSILRSAVSPGTAITMPSPNVSLSLNSSDPTKSCSAWTGTVTWDSDVPSWKITYNVTCSQVGKTGVTLTGTISGDS